MKEFLIKTVRNVMEMYVKYGNVYKPKEFPKELEKEGGVFVTVKKDGKLRGCIGVIYGGKIIENLVKSATSVCRDPRFPPLSEGELDKVKIEVSILTTPELIRAETPEEVLEKIEIGKDGLILELEKNSGLFLAVVPVEQKWDKKQYLENLGLKAGLSTDSWKDEKARIFKFQVTVFEE